MWKGGKCGGECVSATFAQNDISRDKVLLPK